MWVWAFVGVIAFFMVLAIGAVWWARAHLKQTTNNGQAVETKDQFLKLASRAAADPSGRSLVELLEAIDRTPADCPVIVEWVRRPAFKDQPAGMLLKITWDGNEWRRVYELASFRDQLGELVAIRQCEEGSRARRLLAAMNE